MISSIPKFLIVASLCALISTSLARPLTRSERQAASRELASGLTATGTSFNSIYDPYMGYFPQQQTDLYNGVYDDQRIYDSNYQNDLYGLNTERPYYSGKGSYGRGYGGYSGVNGAGGWRGFGAGKDGIVPPLNSQYGVKY